MKAMLSHSPGGPDTLKLETLPDPTPKKGEAVLTEDDPFHPNNRSSMGSSGSSEPKLKVVNGIDSASFLEAALNTDVGERVLLNWLRANSDAVSNSR